MEGSKKTGLVGDSALRAIAMGKKNQQLAAGLSDPVQAALLKAAARQMRCSKPEENAEGLHPIFTPGLGQVVGCQVKKISMYQLINTFFESNWFPS